MTLQENLDYFKTHKVPSKTLFGEYRNLVPNATRIYINHENPFPGVNGKTAKSGAIPAINNLPKYVRYMSEVMTISELLKELSNAFAGKDINI